MIETRRRSVALAESAKDLKQNRGGKVRSSTPRGKRDTVRAGGGII